MAYNPYEYNKPYKAYEPIERIFSQDIRYDRDEVRFRLQRDVQEYIDYEVMRRLQDLMPTIKESVQKELKPGLKLEILKKLGSQQASANLDF